MNLNMRRRYKTPEKRGKRKEEIKKEKIRKRRDNGEKKEDKSYEIIPAVTAP